MRVSTCAVALLSLLTAATEAAYAGDSIVRFGVHYLSPTGDSRGSGPIDSEVRSNGSLGTINAVLDTETEPDGAPGVVFEYEREFTDLIGIAVSLTYVEHEIEQKFSGPGTYTPTGGPPEDGTLVGSRQADLRMIPVTVRASFHVLRADAVDLYVGPVVGYVFFGDLEGTSGTLRTDFPSLSGQGRVASEDAAIDDDAAFGLTVGVDMPFGRGGTWAFSAAATYLEFEAKMERSGSTLPIDPFTVQLGVAARF